MRILAPSHFIFHSTNILFQCPLFLFIFFFHLGIHPNIKIHSSFKKSPSGSHSSRIDNSKICGSEVRWRVIGEGKTKRAIHRMYAATFPPCWAHLTQECLVFITKSRVDLIQMYLRGFVIFSSFSSCP